MSELQPKMPSEIWMAFNEIGIPSSPSIMAPIAVCGEDGHPKILMATKRSELPGLRKLVQALADANDDIIKIGHFVKGEHTVRISPRPENPSPMDSPPAPGVHEDGGSPKDRVRRN
jgi:hypothetical protein